MERVEQVDRVDRVELIGLGVRRMRSTESTDNRSEQLAVLAPGSLVGNGGIVTQVTTMVFLRRWKNGSEFFVRAIQREFSKSANLIGVLKKINPYPLLKKAYIIFLVLANLDQDYIALSGGLHQLFENGMTILIVAVDLRAGQCLSL
ncbi:hypothetical protein J437_LFUL010741 [Ladona fulva]|uniref:Uncharacterized protein n=1 Tax=Ladona fulva TaxID=123851 RepID=A0A8K0KB29_LADFU|nr:hypothetical protein J437_LFUL010741 [Ladona fulva]